MSFYTCFIIIFQSCDHIPILKCLGLHIFNPASVLTLRIGKQLTTGIVLASFSTLLCTFSRDARGYQVPIGKINSLYLADVWNTEEVVIVAIILEVQRLMLDDDKFRSNVIIPGGLNRNSKCAVNKRIIEWGIIWETFKGYFSPAGFGFKPERTGLEANMCYFKWKQFEWYLVVGHSCAQ